MSEILSDGRGAATSSAASARRNLSDISQFVPPAIAGLVAGCSFLAPLASAGLWAPHELNVANLSRRIAVGLHGAQQLALDGPGEAVPTLGELGRGQLPFSSVAVGFQALSLSDWAGRLPLALWSALGVLALYRLVRRFMDATAAAYAAVALSTMPLYFLQARTMLGDAVILSSVSVAMTGLAMLTFGQLSPRGKFVWGLLSLSALAAGFLSRGVLFGIACPALGIGLAWLISQLNTPPARSATARHISNTWGALSLTLGSAAVILGTWALLYASKAMALELLGLQAHPPKKLPTHDSVLHQLGHGLFPWSSVAPFLLAAALAACRQTTAPSDPNNSQAQEIAADDPTATLVLCASCVFLVSLAVHGLALPATGPLPFVGTSAIAVFVAVGFRHLDAGKHRTRLLALGSVALLVILAKDLKDDPHRAMAAFAVGSSKFPDSFRTTAENILRYGTPPCILLITLWLGDFAARQPRTNTHGTFGKWTPSLCQPEGELWQRWRQLRHGRYQRLWLLALAVSTVLLIVAALVLVDQHLLNIPAIDSLGRLRPLARVGFLTLPMLLGIGALGLLIRDLLEGFFAWLPWPRSQLCWLSLSAFAMVMSLGFYPALARQLSPRGVFSEYAKRAAPGDALAVLGNARQVAPFYAKEKVSTPASPAAAYQWLTAASSNRRWLVQSEEDLAPLNSMFRKKTLPPENLPVIFAQSSDISLSANQLLPGEENLNPLDAWIHNEPLEIQHPLTVELKKQLRCLGWGLVTPEGMPVAKAYAGRNYVFRTHWEVLAPLHKTWKAFIHIDGGGRRHNGDHDVLEGKYPMRFWQVGDFITDDHSIRFESHFSGSQYEVFFGLYSGKTRLQVITGEHHDNRIKGGTLHIH